MYFFNYMFSLLIPFSAEYQWEQLLASCYEAKYREKCEPEDLDNMSITEKNALINESVVQTTLHFNKRYGQNHKVAGNESCLTTRREI